MRDGCIVQGNCVFLLNQQGRPGTLTISIESDQLQHVRFSSVCLKILSVDPADSQSGAPPIGLGGGE